MALARESRVGLLLLSWLGPNSKFGMCCFETARSTEPLTDTDTDTDGGETALLLWPPLSSDALRPSATSVLLLVGLHEGQAPLAASAEEFAAPCCSLIPWAGSTVTAGLGSKGRVPFTHTWRAAMPPSCSMTSTSHPSGTRSIAAASCSTWRLLLERSPVLRLLGHWRR